MARIVSVVNQKGGVGKTTTVINIGAALALIGKKVLLVDFDPQGNMSAGLNVDPEQIVDKNAYSAVVGINQLYQNIVETKIKNLWVVPTDNNLAGAEIELVGEARREFRLKESLSPEINHFDYVFIDCPPSLGLLTLNALCASNAYLLPMQAEFFSLQGFTNMLKTIELIKSNLNPGLEEEGILITMFDSKTKLSKEVLNEIRAFAGDRVFANVIPRRVKLSESTSHGVPGIVYDPSCYGSRSYLEVAKEIILRSRGVRLDKPAQPFIPPDPVDRVGQQTRSPENAGLSPQ